MSFSSANEKIGRYRWTICALVFAATTINYLDRNVLGLLKKTLSEDGVFGASPADQELNYSTVVICFQLAYAIGMLLSGRIIDKVGTKKGYAYSLIGWSFAAIGHAFGHHTWSFGLWRALLGITEAGNFPAANKTMAEWFPKKERAFATGFYNSGANVGAIIAPLTVPYIAMKWGWEWAFVLTGAVGLLWLFFWYRMYASPAAKLANGQLSQAEFNYIHSDIDEQAIETEESHRELPKMFEGIFSFKGRALRGTFWAFTLISIFVSYVFFTVFSNVLAAYEGNPSATYLTWTGGGVFASAVIWFVAALHGRRWRDIGLPGWLAIFSVAPAVCFVPIAYMQPFTGTPTIALGVFLVALAFLGLKPGAGEKNEYGSKKPTLFDWKQTWAFVVGKFLTDPIWWFFLFWLPAFLEGENARKVREYIVAHPGYVGEPKDVPGVISWPLAVAIVYTVSTVGSVVGGWLPKKFIDTGMDANKARKLAMFIYALFPLTVLFASRLGEINTWFAVATIAVACAAHAAWSANIFTTVSDMFPKKAVASVTGIGGMAGAVGGILIARAAGLLLKHFTELGKVELGYGILFIVCGSAYIIAWTLMHLLVPKFKKIVL